MTDSTLSCDFLTGSTAEQMLDGSVRVSRRINARSYLARCHFHWAMVLADRGDAARAREQGEITIALGSQLGMTGPQGVVPRAEAILTEL